MIENVFRLWMVSTLSFATVSALAEPIPLLELTYQQTDFEFGPLPVSTEFQFSAGNRFSGAYLNWLGNHTTSDVGQSFWATSDIVAGANLALADLDAEYGISNGFGNFVAPFRLEPTPPVACGVGGFCLTFLVDDVANHTITSLERVINTLIFTELQPHEPPGQIGSFTIQASQTIRYWGTPIPEPLSFLVWLPAIVYVNLNLRRRRSN